MAIDDFLNATPRSTQNTPNPQEDANMFTDILAAPFRGVEGAVQSLYDLADFATGDDLLPDYDTRFLGRSKTFAGGMVEGVSQFMTGFIPVAGQLSKVGKLSTAAKGLKGARGVRRLNVKGNMAAGAIADFSMFQAQEERLSNLIETFPSLNNPISEYLAADADDGEIEGRLKNTLEGLALGGVVDGLIAGVRAIKKARNGDDPRAVLEEYQSAVFSGQRDAKLLQEDFDSTQTFRATLSKAMGRDVTGEPTNAFELLQGFSQGYDGELAPLFKALLSNAPESLKTTMVNFSGDRLSTFKSSVDNATGQASGLITMGEGGVRTLAHELMHATTLHKLNVDIQHVAESPAAFKEMMLKASQGNTATSGLARTYLKAIEKLGMDEKVFGSNGVAGVDQVHGSATRASDTPYAFTNLAEFVSEAFSNEEFRLVLSAMEGDMPKKSVFDELLMAVKGLLGLQATDGSLLDDVFKYTGDIVSQQNRMFDEKFAFLKDVDQLHGQNHRTLDDRGSDFTTALDEDGLEIRNEKGEALNEDGEVIERISEMQSDDLLKETYVREDWKLNFGGKQWRGKRVSEVPSEYLKKALEWDSVKPYMKEKIDRELLDRKENGEELYEFNKERETKYTNKQRQVAADKLKRITEYEQLERSINQPKKGLKAILETYKKQLENTPSSDLADPKNPKDISPDKRQKLEAKIKEVEKNIATGEKRLANIEKAMGGKTPKEIKAENEFILASKGNQAQKTIETVDRISPELLRENPDKFYLFGDNLEGRGKGGQAVVRDEPNAIGIPTKKAPRRDDSAYFTDDELASNKAAIDKAFAKLPADATIVIPKDGLGTGLAALPQKAPKTFAYLESKIESLKTAQPAKEETASSGGSKDVKVSERIEELEARKAELERGAEPLQDGSIGYRRDVFGAPEGLRSAEERAEFKEIERELAELKKEEPSKTKAQRELLGLKDERRSPILNPTLQEAYRRYRRNKEGGLANQRVESFKEYVGNRFLDKTSPMSKRKKVPDQFRDEGDTNPYTTEMGQAALTSEKKLLSSNPNRILHFTTKESAIKILEKGYDVSLPPVFGVGDNAAGIKTEKFAGNVMYFTRDPERWSKAERFVGKGKGNTTLPTYDYNKQKWEKIENAYKSEDLSAVAAEIRPDAKVLSLGSREEFIEFAGEQFTPYLKGSTQNIIKKASQDGFDVVNIHNRDGKWDKGDYESFSGRGGNDDFFVLNRDAVEIEKASKDTFGQADAAVDQEVAAAITRLAKQLTTGGEKAILSAARNINSSRGAVGVISAIAEHLNTTGVKGEKVTAESLAAETKEMVDLLGGNENTWLGAVERLKAAGGTSLADFRTQQRAAKTLIDIMSRDLVDLAKEASAARKDPTKNLAELEARVISGVDQLAEVQRIWSLMGKEAGLSLVQRKFLDGSKGGYRLNKDVGFDFIARDPSDYAKYTTETTGTMDVQDVINKLIMAGSDEDVARAINATGADDAANARMKAVGGLTSEMKGGRMMNMVTEYWMNSLLSGPATQVVNTLGSGLTTALRMGELAFGGLLQGDPDIARALLGFAFKMENFREAATFARKAWDTQDAVLTKGSVAFNDANKPSDAITGQNVSKMFNEKGKSLPEGQRDSIEKAVDALGTGVRLPSRGLMTVDEFFKQLNYRMYVRTNLALEGLQSGKTDGKELAEFVHERFNNYVTKGGRAYNEANVYLDAVETSKTLNGLEYGGEQRAVIQAELARQPYDPSRGGIADAALEYAKVNTFTNDLAQDSVVGILGESLGKLKTKIPMLNFVVPFINTPTNILKFALDRTPLGMGADLIYRRKKLTEGLKNEDPMVRAQTAGRLATGASAVAVGMWYTLSNKEFITGGGPRTQEEKEALQLTGWQPYSFKIGNKYVSYQRVDPMATVIGLFADLVEAEEYYDLDDTAMGNMFSAVALSFSNNVTNKSYVKGLDSMLNMLRDPAANSKALAGNIAGGFVPTLFSQGQNYSDERVIRETRTVFDYMLKKSPASGILPKKRNFLGEAVKYENLPMGAGILNPIYFSTESDNMVDQELGSLAHGFNKQNSKIGGTLQTKDIYNDDGRQAYDVWLEKTSTTKIGGKTLRQTLARLIKSKEYQALSPESDRSIGEKSPRIRAVNNWLRRFRKQARQEMLEEFPELQQSLTQLTQEKQQYRLIQ